MSLYPRVITEYLATLEIPRGPDSRIFLVDTEHGVDTALGDRWTKPLKTLIKAQDKCVTDRHDTVLFIARDTPDYPVESVVWDNDYNHLIGLGPTLYGVGQRSRVVLEAAIAETPVITFSGKGCIVKNMQFYQEKVTGAASGAVIVTGLRNFFENVFFMSPVATDAGSYSLKLAAGESVFLRCSIGQRTNPRTGASRSLWLYKGAGINVGSKFVKCEFLSWSSGTTHVLVYVDADITNDLFVPQFEDCLFDNLPIGAGAGTLAVAIDDNCPAVHQILLRGVNDFAGVTAVADPLTSVLTADHDGVHGGLMAAVNEA